MNNKHSRFQVPHERGAALITALVFLVILTMLGLSSIGTTTMEERMAANAQEVNRAFQAASTGLEMAYNDGDAFDTSLTEANDGSGSDKYDKSDASIGGSGTHAYTANATYNSVYKQSTTPSRGSGWDSSYAYYHFKLSSTGTTDSGATSTVNSGAYQVGKGS